MHALVSYGSHGGDRKANGYMIMSFPTHKFMHVCKYVCRRRRKNIQPPMCFHMDVGMCLLI